MKNPTELNQQQQQQQQKRIREKSENEQSLIENANEICHIRLMSFDNIFI